jgi:hypothetical protein
LVPVGTVVSLIPRSRVTPNWQLVTLTLVEFHTCCPHSSVLVAVTVVVERRVEVVVVVFVGSPTDTKTLAEISTPAMTIAAAMKR